MGMYRCALASYHRYKEIVYEVEDYMKHRQIPTSLQKRILAYFDIKYRQYYFNSSKILQTISMQLHEVSLKLCPN